LLPLATFTSPGPIVFQLGPLVLRWYGLLIAAAVLIGLALATRLGRERQIAAPFISDLLPVMVVSSVLGARLYYVLLEWRHYGTILFCRWRRQPLWPLLDVLVPALALGQAIGRWGNFFNSEAFGLPTNLPWKLMIPLENRPAGFITYSTFHPTFLYESLWNLGVCALLLFLFFQGVRRKLSLPAGALSCIYLMAYSSGRVWIEGLRLDPLCLGAEPPFCSGGLRMAQLVSLILIALGGLGLWRLYGQHQSLPDPTGVTP
jgi:phosphatidylglycerol:prolipoprotein diacylglycerol transferase